MMGYDDEEQFLNDREEERAAKADKEVALAERDAPQELIELKASITKDQFLESITFRALDRLFNTYGNDGLEHNIRKHLHAVVERQAREVVERVLEEQVAKSAAQICADGFQATDSYGQPKGERKTIAAFVLEHLNSKSDEYNHRGKSIIFTMADKLVEAYLEKEIKPELEKLKARCKNALDANVVSKLREAMMVGLGLKGE